MRNALANAGKSGRRVVSAFIATAFALNDAEAACQQWRRVADQLCLKLPKLAVLMDDAKADDVAVPAGELEPVTAPAQVRARDDHLGVVNRLGVFGILLCQQRVMGLLDPVDPLVVDGRHPRSAAAGSGSRRHFRSERWRDNRNSGGNHRSVAQSRRPAR